jgi:hypothetical protein
MSSSFAALENFYDNVVIDMTWESIRRNTRASAGDSIGY